MSRNSPHLAVIGDREALVWVLENRRLAFPWPRYHRAFPTLGSGDQLYLYTTRGCFKNPTRDRGRVIGLAEVTDDLYMAAEPVVVGDRPLPLEVTLEIKSLTPVDEGVLLSKLVPEMTSFPKPGAWSVYLRRSLYPLTDHDARLLDNSLDRFAGMEPGRIKGYRQKARLSTR